MSELAKTASLEVPQTGEEVRYWPKFLGWVIHFVEPMAKCLSDAAPGALFIESFRVRSQVKSVPFVLVRSAKIVR